MQVWCVQNFQKIINPFNHQFWLQCLDDMEDKTNTWNWYPCLRNCCICSVQYKSTSVLFYLPGH